MKAHSSIQLCLADDVLWEIAEEDIATGLWLKLELVYDKVPDQQALLEAAPLHPLH